MLLTLNLQCRLFFLCQGEHKCLRLFENLNDRATLEHLSMLNRWQSKGLHMNVWDHENGYAKDCTFSKALKTCSLYTRGYKVFRQPTWKYNHSGSILCRIKLYFPLRSFSASLKAVRHLPSWDMCESLTQFLLNPFQQHRSIWQWYAWLWHFSVQGLCCPISSRELHFFAVRIPRSSKSKGKRGSSLTALNKSLK